MSDRYALPTKFNGDVFTKEKLLKFMDYLASEEYATELRIHNAKVFENMQCMVSKPKENK